jgi:hypothetical protein
MTAPLAIRRTGIRCDAGASFGQSQTVASRAALVNRGITHVPASAWATSR